MYALILAKLKYKTVALAKMDMIVRALDPSKKSEHLIPLVVSIRLAIDPVYELLDILDEETDSSALRTWLVCNISPAAMGYIHHLQATIVK